MHTKKGVKQRGSNTSPRYITSRNLLFFAATALLVLLVVPKVSSLEDSVIAIKDAGPWFAGLGLAFTGLTYILTAASYRALVLKPVPFWRLVVVQTASGFVSKLLPSGTGSLALNARFLIKNGHSVIRASSIATINNLMGFASINSLLILLIISGNAGWHDAFRLHLSLPGYVWFLLIGLTIGLGAALLWLPKVRRLLAQYLREVATSFGTYRRHPLRLLASYLAAVAITLCFSGALYASARAFGVDLSPLQVLLTLVVSLATAAVTPTPGGIGGAEAGLTAALVTTGQPASIALTIALLYRIITYWIPVIPGFIAFRHILYKRYI